jgi:hypothetical protein
VRRITIVVRPLLAGFVSASALFVLPSANAKDFHPGDLRVCNRTHCVAVVNRAVLPELGSFYYSGPSPARVHSPKLGAPYYELRFRNGYVSGTAFSATASISAASPKTGGTQSRGKCPVSSADSPSACGPSASRKTRSQNHADGAACPSSL